MKYYKNTTTNEVFGYDSATQQTLIDAAIANGWQDVTGSWPPAPTLAEIKSVKKDKIRTEFQNATAQPVTDSNGVAWSGGFDSAIKLDAAMRLAQTAGQATVTFFDDANMPHTLTIADAQAVVLTVASDYQTKLAHKQQLFLQIDAATTQAEIDAVAW